MKTASVVTLQLTATVSDYDRVTALAKAQGLATSRLLRAALDDYLTGMGLDPLEPIKRHGGPRSDGESRS